MAPFHLSATGGRALWLSLSAAVALILGVFIAHHLGFSDSAMTVVLVLAAAATVWFIFEFQRHLLLGKEEPPGNEPVWKRVGIYAAVVFLLTAVFSVVSGMLLAVAMPVIAALLLAAAGNQPWFASGSLILYGVCLAIAAYPVARMALVLPALAAGHGFDPKHAWRLSDGNGVKLLLLVIAIPGVLQLLATTAFTDDSVTTARIITGIAISSIYFVFSAALVASAYYSLSDVSLSNSAFVRQAPLTNRVATAVLLLLVGITVAYQPVFHDMSMNASTRDPDRSASNVAGTYIAAGQTTLLTNTKQQVSLEFNTEWRIADPDRFLMTTGDNVTATNFRLTDASVSLLRNIASLNSFEEFTSAVENVDGKMVSAGAPHPESLFAGSADEIFDIAQALGVQILSFNVEFTEPSL